VSGDDLAAGFVVAHREDVAEFAASAKHELDLALAIAKQLDQGRQGNERRAWHARGLLGADGPTGPVGSYCSHIHSSFETVAFGPQTVLYNRMYYYTIVLKDAKSR
jgi:hypothetical protein